VGRSAVSADFNRDGYPDIYLVNFHKPNKLYINNRNGTFRDATSASGVGFSGASVQAAVTDYDSDGDFDIFVVNQDGPSVLYRNQGNGKFQNATAAAGLAGPLRGVSATFSDFDRDGDEDLILVQSGAANLLYSNLGQGRFAAVPNVDLSGPDHPTSVSAGDPDGDGDSDIAIGDSDQGANSGDSAYRNAGGAGNNFLVVALQGTRSNKSAIGAKVLVRAGSLSMTKVVNSGNGQNQDSLPLEFGLASAATATVIVEWPNGAVQTTENVNANSQITVTEPQ
jgi:hypothetical protein